MTRQLRVVYCTMATIPQYSVCIPVCLGENITEITPPGAYV